MQKVKLPHQIDPVKSALQRSDYEGVVNTSDMVRLNNIVVSSDDYVEANVQFLKDEQGLTVFRGSLMTSVELLCQRCNEAFKQNLNVEFCYSPVQGEDEFDSLPEAYEPVEVDEHGMVNLLQLFEDDLMVSLPLVPRHAEAECTVTESDMQFGQLKPEDERPNPFAVLKELKRD
ncbi:23S rRNA accumulation protein YceD [Alteromonas sp. 5E99-2]|uniref:23S rRNA accumulation protein YceD n=1 Tax=Alteromonas sp. 5E99-2 TaxID=2817683 RepID=UPI001A97DAFE|nr:23S rRNA accumulation protein YceD [Alteromonas sp. 5E99-2]MBO1254957.1 23S rRNA accumulation protein YceD [Alteromonas sp. 5E99-2]